MEKKTKLKFSIIMVIAIILLAIATIPKTLQEDTFYMVKVGEYICQNGIEVIDNQVEPFTWHEGMIYTYPHWLLDVIFYLIYNAFDMMGIYAFTVIIGIIIYVLIYYTNVKITKNYIISAIITIISIYLLKGFITARAQIITFICLLLEIVWIERFLETKKKRYGIGLVVLPIVLANCHAALFPMYFVIFLPYIAEYLISYGNKEEIYQKRIKRKNKKRLKWQEKGKQKRVEKIEKSLKQLEEKVKVIEDKRQTKQNKIEIQRNRNVRWLIIIFIVCIFTGMITPLKDIPYTYMIKSLMGNTMDFILEHQSVVLIQSIALLVIFFVIQALLFSNKVKIRLQDIFMLVGMSILALISYKQFPIFWISVMCIMNKLVEMVVSDTIKEKVKKGLNKVLTIKGMLYTILVLMVLFLVQYKEIAGQNYIDSDEYPVLATEWLKTNVKIDKMKLFNDFNYGSYLLFKNIPVFIDGRADVYDPKFNGKQEDVFTDYMTTTSLQVWYADIFQKYGITHIMIKDNSNLNLFLQRNISYKKIYDDGTFSIYECLDIK